MAAFSDDGAAGPGQALGMTFGGQARLLRTDKNREDGWQPNRGFGI